MNVRYCLYRESEFIVCLKWNYVLLFHNKVDNIGIHIFHLVPNFVHCKNDLDIKISSELTNIYKCFNGKKKIDTNVWLIRKIWFENPKGGVNDSDLQKAIKFNEVVSKKFITLQVLMTHEQYLYLIPITSKAKFNYILENSSSTILEYIYNLI